MNDGGPPHWVGRAIVVMIPVGVAVIAWSFNMESRLQAVSSRFDERGNRITSLETRMSMAEMRIADPSPKPEARVMIDDIRREMSEMREKDKALFDRQQRLDDRLNNLHLYLMTFAPPRRR